MIPVGRAQRNPTNQPVAWPGWLVGTPGPQRGCPDSRAVERITAAPGKWGRPQEKTMSKKILPPPLVWAVERPTAPSGYRYVGSARRRQRDGRTATRWELRKDS